MVHASQHERETLGILMNRLGIDDEETATVVREARALAVATGPNALVSQ